MKLWPRIKCTCNRYLNVYIYIYMYPICITIICILLCTTVFMSKINKLIISYHVSHINSKFQIPCWSFSYTTTDLWAPTQRSSYTRDLLIWEIVLFISFNKLQKICTNIFFLKSNKKNLFAYIKFREFSKSIHLVCI